MKIALPDVGRVLETTVKEAGRTVRFVLADGDRTGRCAVLMIILIIGWHLLL